MRIEKTPSRYFRTIALLLRRLTYAGWFANALGKLNPKKEKPGEQRILARVDYADSLVLLVEQFEAALQGKVSTRVRTGDQYSI